MNKSIKNSWKANASEWIALLKREGIPSRAFTNKAIIDVVCNYASNKILDLGCGEGWLTRALSNNGFIVTGVDATTSLISEARNRSDDKFHVMSYEEIVQGEHIHDGPFDTIVFNYSLYENELTMAILNVINRRLTPNGQIVIQTIHPNYLIQQKLPNKSQWIQNAWSGLDGDFIKPHAWYARNMEDWVNLFKSTNYRVEEIFEIANEKTRPVSVIFVLKRN